MKGTEIIGKKGNTKLPLNNFFFFNFMDSQTLEQVAQRSYGVSTLRDVQIPTGHGFEKPVLLYAHINLLLQRAFHEKVDLIFV